MLSMFGWIFRGWAMASATALFGPWPYSSFVRRSLRPLPHCRWSGLRLRMGALIIRPLQEGVVFAISGRRGLSTRLASSATPGYGESPERNSIFPQLRFLPDDGCAGVGPARWRRRRGEWSQLPKTEVVLAVGLVLYGGGFFISLYTTKNSLIQSVAVHAVLGSGAPR